MEKTVFSCINYTISRVGIDRLHDVARFVVTENYIHHSTINFPDTIQVEIDEIYQEELTYRENSEYYIVRDKAKKMIGCIRVFRWDKHTPTPMEKVFHISPLEKIGNSQKNSFWHIGRFAINSSLGFSSLTLFKQLMAIAVAPIMRNQDSYMIAETDCRLLKIMNALGIKTQTLGQPLVYLASETIPICSSKDDLSEFYSRYYPLDLS